MCGLPHVGENILVCPHPLCLSQQHKHSEEPEAHASGACLLPNKLMWCMLLMLSSWVIDLGNMCHLGLEHSEAKGLLKEDVENGLHLQLKPKALWLFGEEYMKFDLKVFRHHMHQETRGKLETNYWITKRKKATELKKAINKEGNTLGDLI